MRRIVLLATMAVLAGCSGDEAASSTPGGTVAIGELPAALPGPSTTSTAPPTTPPPTTAPSDSTVLADELVGMFDGTLPTAPGMDVVEDDTGRLSIQVPSEWGDRRTTRAVADDGGDVPSVAASTDLVEFLDGYDEPGMTAVVLAETPVEALRAYRFDEDCERMKQGHYRDDRLEGEYRSWRNCGGTGTGLVAVAAEIGGDTVLVLAQVLGPADLLALDLALDSVRVSG